jgi:hypothetical protein
MIRLHAARIIGVLAIFAGVALFWGLIIGLLLWLAGR